MESVYYENKNTTHDLFPQEFLSLFYLFQRCTETHKEKIPQIPIGELGQAEAGNQEYKIQSHMSCRDTNTSAINAFLPECTLAEIWN